MLKTKPQSLWMIHQYALLAVLTLFVSSVMAQPIDPALLAPDPVAAGVKFDIDTFTMLRSEELFPSEVQGPVWVARANSNFGKMLIQIPVLLEPGDKPVDIDSSLLKVARGTFICFRLDDFGPTAELINQARADNREMAAGNAQQAGVDPNLETAIPVLAKKFTLLPNGLIQYQASTVNPRFVTVAPYAEGDSLYKLKLDPRMAQDMRPVAPERPADRSREAQMTFQATYRTYQRLVSDYLELGKRSRALTKDLEIRKPTRIWVVYEVDNTMDDLVMDGLKPLPWEVKVETLMQLREIVKGQAQGQTGADGVNRLGPDAEAVILQLARLIAKRHPYDLQLAALTVSLTRMVGYAQLGDTQFFLLKAILEADDSMSRKFIMAELRQTMPPTRATVELAKLVVTQGVGNTADKVNAVKEMLKLAKGNPTQARQSAETINTMLTNSDGPAPSTVLLPLFDVSRDNEEVRNVYVQSIRFQSLPENRLNDALVFVVENAGAEPLAAGWLNEHFLGSANPTLLRKTLTTIAEADTGARDLGPMFNWAINKLFGKPVTGQQSAMRKARMRLPIPIMTPNDGIFRALQHGNSEIRDLAWRSLPRFTIPPLADTAEALPKETDRYQILTNTALDMLTTPPGVVTFLERQPNKKRVAECLFQIVLRGSSQVQIAGVRALIGCKAPLGTVMLDMSPGERQGFAMLVYEIGANRTPPPMVVNTLRRREANNPVARWFGDEVAKGEIPSTSAWVDQFEGEGQLLELVASNDEALAKGAAAVMITAIGGTDRDALTFREKVRTLSDQTAGSVANAWTSTKLELFAAQLKRYEGHYRMVLMVSEGDTFGGALDVPMREIPVGIVQFRINEAAKTLSLGNDAIEPVIGDSYHTIAINKPDQLATFPGDELAAFNGSGDDTKLKKITNPILLKLQPDKGTFKGAFTIPDGAQVIQAQLLLVPVKTQTPGSASAAGAGV